MRSPKRLMDMITKVPPENLSRNEPTKRDQAIMATDSMTLLFCNKSYFLLLNVDQDKLTSKC